MSCLHLVGARFHAWSWLQDTIGQDTIWADRTRPIIAWHGTDMDYGNEARYQTGIDNHKQSMEDEKLSTHIHTHTHTHSVESGVWPAIARMIVHVAQL